MNRTLTSISVSAFLALAHPVSAEAASWVCDRSPLVITNARLWGAPKPHSMTEIIVADGKIVAVGPSGRLRRPAGSRVVDAHRAWLLPGLIDSHIHFGRAAAISPELLPKPYPGAWGTTGRQTLASGVTTAKIHYADFERAPGWAREAQDDCNPAPRLILGASGLLGGPPSQDAWLPQISGPEDARQKVRQNVAVGAHWLELADTQKFSAVELEAIADEARKSNLRLMADGASFEETEAALRAGAAALDHFDVSPTRQFPTPLVTQMRSRGIFVVAPLGFFARYNAYRADPGLIDADAWVARRFEQPGVADALIAATRERFIHPPESEQALVDNFAAHRSKFRQLLSSRVRLVIGSDSGSQGHFQGDAVWWELRAWRDNGASPGEIVRAATRTPAEMLALKDRGAIRLGARGDVVLYDGDLPRGEFDLRGVRLVAKGGVVYVRDGRWVGPTNPGEGK